jgi:hypothetical protein
MASDSRKSQNQICKKTALQAPKTGKYDYFVAFNQPARSMVSKNFTGDCSVRKNARGQKAAGTPSALT